MLRLYVTSSAQKNWATRGLRGETVVCGERMRQCNGRERTGVWDEGESGH